MYLYYIERITIHYGNTTNNIGFIQKSRRATYNYYNETLCCYNT